MQILIKIINKVRAHNRIKTLKSLNDYLELSGNTYYGNGFSVDLRKRDVKKTFLKIGSQSIINNSFVFENDTGYIQIGDRVHIGGGTQLISINRIDVGNDVAIAWNCTIYDHNSHSVNWEERKNDIVQAYHDQIIHNDGLKNKDWSVVSSKPIIIKDKVWIGFGVTILKGVTIGEGAVIAAQSVVVNDVEPYTVVGGNPAILLKRLEPTRDEI